MVFAGTLSADHSYAMTGICVAAELGWPHVAVVTRLEYEPGAGSATVHRELEAGLIERITVECPAVLTIQLGINQPRYASLRGVKQAKEKPVDRLTPADLGVGGEDLTTSASFRLRRMFKPARGQAELIEGTAAEQAARLATIIKELRGAA
jgi:electron transfer flavoprotein beta subunit